jgi:hypothetical protein
MVLQGYPPGRACSVMACRAGTEMGVQMTAAGTGLPHRDAGRTGPQAAAAACVGRHVAVYRRHGSAVPCPAQATRRRAPASRHPVNLSHVE